MDIRMITFHTPKNYGAVLQAYALQETIQGLFPADSVKIVDYNTEHLRELYPIIKKPVNVLGWIVYLMQLRYYSKYKLRHQKFDAFVSKYLALTERYGSIDELRKRLSFDVLVTGSDQVFNPNRIPEERKVFYLGFTCGNEKKISYAASFGVSEIPFQKKDEIREYLSSFNHISVREDSGIKIVQDFGINDVHTMLDPVFLLSKDQWREISEPYQGLPDRYILYYRLLKNHDADSYVEQFAESRQLPLVVITDSAYNISKSHYLLRDVGPCQFLWLIDHADYITTNSFHGVVFSIIFEKQFISCDMEKKTQIRPSALFRKIGMEKRFANLIAIEQVKEIEYSKVRETLQLEINNSKKYIEMAINN